MNDGRISLSEGRLASEARERGPHALVQGIRDCAILSTDAEGRIVTWNPGARDLFGFEAEVVVGRDARDVLPPEDVASGGHGKELAAAERDGRARWDRWLARKDGSRFWAAGVTSVLRDEAGRVSGFVTVVRDDTERKRLEAQLRSANDSLERRAAQRAAAMEAYQRQLRSLVAELGRTEVRERRRLAGDLHDNLAQLLAVCKLRVSAVEASPRDPAKVAREAEVVKGLLGQAIDYTRVLMGDLGPDVFDDRDVSAAVESVAAGMARHGLRVSVEDDGRPKPLDEDVLGLLFLSVRELLLNVAAHAGTREARVRLERAGGNVRITVADEGRGFNVSRAAAPAGESGFGLFSIRERLDLLGGRMQIESGRGAGTRVTLLAPLRADDGGGDVAGEGQMAVEQGGPGRTIRVLVAHQHSVVREGLRGLVEGQADMAVVGEAADGAAALDLARALGPDVVVMGAGLPVMDGAEATRRLVAAMPGVRVIGFSVDGDGEIAEAMRGAGAAEHLAGDGGTAALFAAIRSRSGARDAS